MVGGCCGPHAGHEDPRDRWRHQFGEPHRVEGEDVAAGHCQRRRQACFSLHGWLRHSSACGDPLPHDPFVASPADQRRPPRLKRAHRTHDRPAGQRQHLETRSSRCHILLLARPSMIRPTRQSTEVDRSDPPICPSRQRFRRPLDDSETEGRRCSIGATSTDVKPANNHSSGDGLGANSPSAHLTK
jgi:hypothetical protein